MEEEILQFKVGQYLSQSQIDIVKGRINSPNRSALVDLVDGFVKSNGTSTPEYQKLLEAIKSIMESIIYIQGKNEELSKNLPFLYELAIFDLFILTGVISQQEMEQAKENIQNVVSSQLGGVIPNTGDDSGSNKA